MAIISKLTNNDSGRRSFRLSPLEMLILGLILVVVFYLISLWITGAFEAPKQAVPTAAPTQLLDRAIAATERVQARLLTIEKKLAALDDRLDKATTGPKGKKIIISPKWAKRLDALEKKVAALGKSSAAKGQTVPKVDLTPLEARIIFLEKKVGEKPGKESLDDRLAKIDQRLEKMTKAPAEASDTPQELGGLEDRLSKLEDRTAQLAKEQDKPAATPAEIKKIDGRLKKLEERTTDIAKAQESPVASPKDLKALGKRLDEIDKRIKKMNMSPTPSALASSSGAISQLEERLEALEKKGVSTGGSSVTVPQDIDDRLRKLESTVTKMEPSEAHTSATVASLETRLQNLERSTPKAGAAAGVAAASLALMETRLHKIEATLAQTSESLRKVRAPVTDPELMQRLQSLEKASGAATQPNEKNIAERAKKIDRRLANIDQRLAELTKAQALTSRHLAGVMDKTKPAPAPSPRISHLTDKAQKKLDKQAEKPPPKTRMVTHTVRRGQTLYGIARRYGVKVDDIRRWNPKLQTRRNLWINEDLTIYTTR
jgi:LysM repeat protein/tetrahydromethanopterin S-methyltransferase subunit G